MQRIRISHHPLCLVAALGLALVAACKGGADKATDKATDKAAAPGPAAAAPAPSTTFSCTKAGDWCTDYSGDALVLGEAALQGACSAMSGTFATGSCSTAKAVGSCNLGKGQVKIYYPSEGNSGDGAKSDCDLHDGKYAAAAP